MENTRILEPAMSQRNKSFYGNAKVVQEYYGKLPDGMLLYNYILFSYETPVCMFDARMNFRRLWHGYSLTTMTHINAFRETYGNGLYDTWNALPDQPQWRNCDKIAKSQWEEMEITE